MKAMVLEKTTRIESKPLKLKELPMPIPDTKQIRIKVAACGICHTELDEIEGRLQPKLPIILGHEVVGTVESIGSGASRFKIGDRVGIAWINSACRKCDFCQQGNENLCPEFQGTGSRWRTGIPRFRCRVVVLYKTALRDYGN